MGTVTISYSSVHVTGGGTKLQATFTWSISGSKSSNSGDAISVRLECTNSNGGSWEIDTYIILAIYSGSKTGNINYSGTNGGTWRCRFINTVSTYNSRTGNQYWSVLWN